MRCTDEAQKANASVIVSTAICILSVCMFVYVLCVHERVYIVHNIILKINEQ